MRANAGLGTPLQCNINEQVIKEVADAIVSSGLAAAGYKYVNIGRAGLRGRTGRAQQRRVQSPWCLWCVTQWKPCAVHLHADMSLCA